MRIASDPLLNLKGKVRFVETYRLFLGWRSYEQLNDGNRKLLREHGNPVIGALSSQVWFDEQGRVIEDIDVDRPLTDQEAYRKSYKYDDLGRLIETVEYNENNRLLSTLRYSFEGNGKRKFEERWSSEGKLQARSELDEYGDLVCTTLYREDGRALEQKGKHQYLRDGNVTEHLQSFSKDEADAFYAWLGVGPHAQAASETHRSVVIHDANGSLREQVHYLPNGSVMKKKFFDRTGALREEHFSSGASDLTVRHLDSTGRVLQMTVVAPAGYLSAREVNDTTTFTYDPYGNLSEMKTTASDGTIQRKITISYLYDEKGNWTESTELEVNETWQTEPFPASIEAITLFERKIEYYS